MGFIYCITSPSCKKYIGQTTRDPDKRFNEHCKMEKHCLLVENAIEKYGKEHMIFEILLEINDDKLDYYETKFINIFDTQEPNGYNIKSGGHRCTHSQESRNRMRISKLKEKNHNFGKHRTETTKAAISAKKSGEKHHFFGKNFTDEHKIKLSQSHKKYNKNLPMYLVYIKSRPGYYQSSGYAVANHPVLKNKYFTSKKLSDDEKLKEALTYLNSTIAVQRLNGNGFHPHGA